VTAKQIAVKRYVVKLSDEERGRLNTLIPMRANIPRGCSPRLVFY
jgi:hypothetical protein